MRAQFSARPAGAAVAPDWSSMELTASSVLKGLCGRFRFRSTKTKETGDDNICLFQIFVHYVLCLFIILNLNSFKEINCRGGVTDEY